MAPRAPTGRAAILTWLRSLDEGAEPSPRPLGSPIVFAGVVRENGAWRIREAVFDHEGFEAFARAQQAAGRPLYPEHADGFRRPTGQIFLEAASLGDFIRAVEAYDWPRDW
ncbi:hypothetical protein [Hyalangium gracile]|uniref:hypothetical protein n=1 Tax=Hyalangium gracile TaxID=394092 RepID=UPI001CCDE002|nr:hypothetical protein [Hyalangium gracile]